MKNVVRFRALVRGDREVKMLQMFGSIEAAVCAPCISGKWCSSLSRISGEICGPV